MERGKVLLKQKRPTRSLPVLLCERALNACVEGKGVH